jgi:hypothetical protein
MKFKFLRIFLAPKFLSKKSKNLSKKIEAEKFQKFVKNNLNLKIDLSPNLPLDKNSIQISFSCGSHSTPVTTNLFFALCVKEVF